MKQGYLREGLWQNVYLLEFYNGSALGDSFAFGVPPESEEIVLPQRKTETKTFGGLIVDDYGCHELKITLAGNTVNNELRRIYHTDGQQEYLTGEDEIFKLKALIEKYKQNKNTMGSKILLYDLSKHGNIRKKKKTIDSFCWEVFPAEFKIKRSKERPFTYTYSIEFTAVGTESKLQLDKTVRILGVDFNPAFDKINKYLDDLESKFAFMKTAIAKINETRAFVQKCKELTLLAVGGTINVFRTLIDDTFVVGNTVFDLYRETAGGAIPFAIDNSDFAAALLIDLSENIHRLARDIKSATKKEFYMPVGIFDNWETAIEELDTLGQLSLNNIDREIDSMIVTAKMNKPQEQQLQVGENRSITTYGTKIALITDGMNFEKLAQEHYGDSSKAYIIASANSASSMSDLISRNGKYVLIPVLKRGEANFENQIIGLSGQRDSYGKDIALDDYGHIVLNESGSDFKFVSGKKNLSQSILMRLQENTSKRVRLQLYGIKTSIPDSEQAGAAYILSSIIQTLNQEPRIKELKGVSFKGEGDVLKIDIDYTDIGGSGNTIKGVI